MPGWTRFKPAADWIAENGKVAVSQSNGGAQSGNLKEIFEQYLSERAVLTGQKTLSDSERRMLFYEFQQFLAAQNRQ